MRRGDRRWLDDPRNVTRVVYGLGMLCGLAFLADLAYTKHPHFGVERVLGFYAVYGFIGSVALVLTAKGMRPWLRRDDDYYERDHAPRESAEHDTPGPGETGTVPDDE